MTDKKELIIDIKTKLQFCTTIAMFLIGVLQYFFNIYDSGSNLKTLGFVMIPAAYILCYILFDFGKNNFGEKFLKFLNGLVIFGLFTFIPTLIVLALNNNQLVGKLNIILFNIALYALIFTPFAILFLLTIFISFKSLKKY